MGDHEAMKSPFFQFHEILFLRLATLLIPNEVMSSFTVNVPGRYLMYFTYVLNDSKLCLTDFCTIIIS